MAIKGTIEAKPAISIKVIIIITKRIKIARVCSLELKDIKAF